MIVNGNWKKNTCHIIYSLWDCKVFKIQFPKCASGVRHRKSPYRSLIYHIFSDFSITSYFINIFLLYWAWDSQTSLVVKPILLNSFNSLLISMYQLTILSIIKYNFQLSVYSAIYLFSWRHLKTSKYPKT